MPNRIVLRSFEMCNRICAQSTGSLSSKHHSVRKQEKWRVRREVKGSGLETGFTNCAAGGL